MSDTGVTLSESALDVHARHVLALTQVLFFFSLVVCIIISHGTTAETDGISYYGVYSHTIPVVVIGFSIASYGLWRTSTYFDQVKAPALTVWGLRIVAVGLFVLLATPFNRGTFLNWAHMITGVTLALAQMGISLLLLVRHRSSRPIAGFVLQLMGGVIAAAALPDWHFIYLLQGETIMELGFGWCLIEWTYALNERR